MDSTVQPLRISKSTPTSSPDKQAAMSRPLAEISSGSTRRNSPSYNQNTKKTQPSLDPSPFNENASPSPTSPTKPSPHDFWSTRKGMSPSRVDAAPDRAQSPSVMSAKRRASIEKLQSAGRVKSSKIFSLENRDVYDPDVVPIVERPSANRPLSEQFVRNTFTRFDTMRNEKSPIRGPGSPRPAHLRTESENSVAKFTPTKLAASIALPESPEKEGSPSPTKSALSRISQFGANSRATFDHDTGSWSDGEELAQTPRALHRQNKSVTFNTSPPMINEYEQQTPEPSVSAASDSREGSYDSDDYYEHDISFDRGSSVDNDREDSFDDDLENIDKTPVVLPEHWSRMSPDAADDSLVNEDDDVFHTGSPATQRPILGRSESAASDGDSRPLPPLPGLSDKSRRESAQVAAVAQRASDAARNLPPPARRNSNDDEPSETTPQAGSSPLVERAQDLESVETAKVLSSMHLNPKEAKLDGTSNDLSNGEHPEADDGDDSVLTDLDEYAGAPPRISRESILRKVRNTKYDFEDEDEEEVDEYDYVDEQHKFRPSYAELAQMHPDQPIPSREHSIDEFASPPHDDQDEQEVVIKEEPVDESIDLAAIPTMDETRMSTPRSPSRLDDFDPQTSVLHHDIPDDSFEEETDGSMYSLEDPELESTVLHQESEEPEDGKETLQEAMGLLTVKDYSQPSQEPTKPEQSDKGFTGLPEYLRGNDDYDFGIKTYTTPSPPPSNDVTKQLDTEALPSLQPSTTAQWVPSGAEQLPQTTAETSRPDTPDSVIHHSTDLDDAFEDAQADMDEQDEDFETELGTELDSEPMPQRQEIPERRATIKTGGKLKARPSGTPADFDAMFEDPNTDEFPVPAIPDGYQAQIENADSSFESNEGEGSKVDSGIDSEHHTTGKSDSDGDVNGVKLNIDIPAVEYDDWGLEREFDRVIEKQKVCSPTFYSSQDSSTNGYVREKKGYTMRENDKLVVASNRNFSGSSNGTTRSHEPPASEAMVSRPSLRTAKTSPRKPSAEQYIKTEPWTGKQRRKSKRSSSVNRPKPAEGAAPPLPGQESALGIVSEDQAADDGPEGAERGRLFVKVVGVKSLDLPLPRNDRVYFKLTLDNGLHCVTTAPLELGKNAPIGQEFELVVHDDLEFQLTLNTKLPPKSAPPPTPSAAPASPSKHQKQSSISKFLSSPKKRAERERQEREAQEAEQRRQQQEAQRKRAALHPSAWDLMHDLVNAADGSFARSYVNLSSHEPRCFGRPLTVDVPCYNEWALEKNSMVVNSVRSKRGAHAGPVRKPPYIIGTLELQLLYVPKPSGATDEEMPKSMSSAIREMNRAHEVTEVSYEGVLSQQGGDCQHWRRRYFRLQGPRLTAYHEHTNQKRAVINLSKAVRLVDDRRTLLADPVTPSSPAKTSGGSRRKSAFAEEDDGYQYVEEGFRIRFANGETIDFYADSKTAKEEWMNQLAQVVGKADPGNRKKGWTDLVFAHERSEGAKAAALEREAIEKPLLEGAAAVGGTAVRDFTKPPPSQNQSGAAALASWPSKQPSERKPVAGQQNRQSAYVPGSTPVGNRAGTPPLSPRTGHRSRDAVKSMIF